MARTVAEVPGGARVTDFISLGVISRKIPAEDIRRVLKETGRYLGVGLCNIVHLLNPEVIAIGGGVAGAGDFILVPARNAVADHVMHERLAGVRIVPAELGNEAALLGAALIASVEFVKE